MSEPVLFGVLVLVPLVLLWAAVIVDLVRREDISIGRKLIWGAATIVFLTIGVLAYVIARPWRFPEDDVSADSQDRKSAELLEAVTSHQEGGLSDDELVSAKEAAKQAIN